MSVIKNGIDFGKEQLIEEKPKEKKCFLLLLNIVLCVTYRRYVDSESVVYVTIMSELYALFFRFILIFSSNSFHYKGQIHW